MLHFLQHLAANALDPPVFVVQNTTFADYNKRTPPYRPAFPFEDISKKGLSLPLIRCARVRPPAGGADGRKRL
jgi:hypothetical protein